MTELALQVDQTRAEGLIGASDAAAILGMDRYKSPLSVWRRLRGEPEDERPAFVREAADWGQILEPVVRGKYALLTRSTVYVPTTSTVLDGWLRCTPDGYVFEKSPSPGTFESAMAVTGADGLVQVKTASAYLRDAWSEGVPPAYEVQVRTEMLVTGLPWCDVVCLVGGQTFVGPIRIHRDEKAEAAILRDLRAFWHRVQDGVEPDIDGSAAWRAYASSHMRPTKVDLQADAGTLAILEQWKATRKQLGALKEREDAIKTSILVRLAGAGANRLVSSFGNVSTYPVKARVDWRKYAMSLGGTEDGSEAFRPDQAPTWAVRAPKGFGDDDGE